MTDQKVATTITGGQIQGVAGAGSVVIENFTIINRSAEEPTAPIAGAEPIPPCPYPGLAYFEPNDSNLFFGRDAAIARLTEAVGRQSLTALIGASGSGKSSVVLAGLAPHLNAAAEWRFSHFRIGNEWGHDPFLALARALVPLYVASASDTERLRNTRLLAASLKVGELTLADVFADCRSRNKGRRILLIADQFEEAFTLVADEAVRDRFIDVLLAGFPDVPGGAPDICLITTLRADFYGLALRHRPLADALQGRVENLGPMNRQELQAAITRPAENAKVSFEPGLVETLLDDVASKPGSLPLLQFALREMWGGLDSRRMTRAGYDRIGGVEGALAQRAQAIYDTLTAKGEDAHAVTLFRRLFTRLVTLGEGAEDTRRIVARSELGEEAWALGQRLAGEDNRLVITSAPVPGHETAEVVHEALIRNWPALIEWVNRDRAFQSWLRQLKLRVDEWRAHPEDQGTLLRGGPLAVAEEWLGRRGDELSGEERSYIEAGIALREAMRRQEAEALAREHARLAEIAAAQARTARIQRLAMGALASVGLLMLGLLGNVLWQQHDTSRREMAVFASLAGQAMKEGQFDRAMRYALQGYPPPGALPWAPFSTEVQGKLAGGALSTDLRRVLRGHTGLVITIEFSPDGKRLVTASNDTTARLWDAESGKEIAVLKGHTSTVLSAVFSPDGKRVVTASWDKTARLWDAASGKAIAELRGHTDAVLSAAFSPDGKRVVTASNDNTARLWAAVSGTEIAVLQGHAGAVVSAAFSPDGTRVVTASFDNTARLWDAESGKETAVLQGHAGAVNSSAFSPDGTRVVTASWDGTARLWDAESGSETAVLQGHASWVNSAAFSPDGKRVATASNDTTARLWDAETGKVIAVLQGHTGELLSAAFSPDGKRVATASNDTTARLWDAETGNAIAIFHGHANRLRSVAFSPDGKGVATTSDDGTARLWDAGSGNEIAALQGHSDSVLSVAFSADGKRVATASLDTTARVWDADSGEEVAVLRGHSDAVLSAVFSPDGKRVATASVDGTARLWDAASGKEVAVLRGHTGEVMSAAFSPDGKQVATAGDTTALLRDAASGKVTAVLQGHTDSVRSASFSSDGKRVATASWDKTARLWDAESGTEVAVLRGHAGTVVSASFSPDGKRVVTAGDTTARLWDADSGKVIAVLQGHTDLLHSAAFSPDGTRVVTAGDATARLWDADSGKEIAVLNGRSNFMRSAAFSPDGTRVVTASADNTARLLDVTWATKVRGEELRARVCTEKLVGAAQEFSPAELDDPILRGVTQTNPCLRRGPLSLDYWTRLPGEWWAWIRGAGPITSTGH
jgi:WD40 repeat protein